MTRFSATQEFRDPVHGLIKLTDLEVRLIDQIPFQRLRGIKQLAMAHLVYPGALHTRFDHSIGTLHTASRILDRVASRERLCCSDIVAVRLAALLHDLGHGPFSHVSEYLLSLHNTLSDSGPMEKIHEKLTVDIINHEPSIACLLTNPQREAISDIIIGSGRRDIKRDIISSDLDADKIDYLSRDAYFTGVKYGVFDLEKIYDSFLYLRQGAESYLGIDESGIFATEQLILAKHHMTQQVYAHRIRVISDYMIVRGLELAIKGGLQEIITLYEYDGSPEFCQRYLKYDDNRVMNVLLQCDLEEPRSIYQRLHERRLFRQLVKMPLTERHISNPIRRSQYINLSAPKKSDLEVAVADFLGCKSWEVIVEVKNVKNPAYQDVATLNPETILIRDRKGNLKTMSAYDDIVVAKLPASDTLYVIAPYDPPVADQQELEDQILEIMDAIIGGRT